MDDKATMLVPVFISRIFCTIFELPVTVSAEFSARDKSRFIVEPAGGVPPVFIPGFIVLFLVQLCKTEGASTRTVPPSRNF
jgi:hypothetical protein